MSYAGVALIIMAAAFFFLEFWVTSHGLLAILGLVSFVAGILVLLSSYVPYFHVNLWVIAGIVVVILVLLGLVITAIVRGQRKKPTSGGEALVGSTAVARTALDPRGKVFLEGEIWDAEVDEGRVETGEEVIITRVHDLKLYVTKKQGGK